MKNQKWFGVAKSVFWVVVTLVFAVWVISHPGHPGGEKKAAGGAFTVAVVDGNPPFAFQDQEKKLSGFYVAAIKLLSEQSGRSIELTPVKDEEALEQLKSGTCDAVIGFAVNPEETPTDVSASYPLCSSGARLFVPSESTIEDADGLAGKTIGVQAASRYKEIAASVSGIKEVVEVEGGLKSLCDALDEKKVDAILDDYLACRYMIAKEERNMHAIGDFIRVEELTFAVIPGDDKLISSLNDELAILKSDPSFHELCSEWFGLEMWEIGM